MTIEQINSIGESEFVKYDFQQTIHVIEGLETIKWGMTEDPNLEENALFYMWLMDTAENKIVSNDFPELKKDETKKTLLLIRILRIQTHISQFRLAFVEQNSINSICEYIGKSVSSFETNLQNKTTETINKIEPQIMSTILTVMGVFTAIITIVMSVVITSGSWLNNANGASAIVAFIVPNLVAVTAMVVLLTIVFSRKNEKIIVIPGRDWESKNVIEKNLRKSKSYLKISVGALILCLVAMLSISVKEMKNSVEPHTRYIITEDMYDINIYEFDVKENEEPKEPEVKIEFDFVGMNKSIAYDEKYIHDGNLYYCEEHDRLE